MEICKSVTFNRPTELIKNTSMKNLEFCKYKEKKYETLIFFIQLYDRKYTPRYSIYESQNEDGWYFERSIQNKNKEAIFNFKYPDRSIALLKKLNGKSAELQKDYRIIVCLVVEN